ncbi:2-oxoglutarate and iron-dependent oxygenase JMJD4 [Nephila pilipes]|uniref:2-oxoglutarate and iron-dependent oxygenase JMJD4 n=1 Tax=Nephila pilipes TaxID=299642 RepID=A0A8X6MWL6_NEPPI|nr:2-oxoglutarate and iron-dependent oxygenase JMJD4 [Nephila pilipes]
MFKEKLQQKFSWCDPDTVSGLPTVNYSAIDKIERISNVPYEYFFSNYLRANVPCIITSSVTKNWKSRLEWVSKNGQPNFVFLEQEFGSTVVPVSDCNIREYNTQHSSNMLFKDYLSYWQALNETTKEHSPCLYLKDWHFQRIFPNYEAYNTPEYFQSDWLNEFCETQKDDYKFVYMGPKGTWTPLHADVYGSYSWSANICGKKRWLLFPPGQEELLKDEKNQLLYSLDADDLQKCKVTYFDIIQEAGEIIFVPSGWYHQVWNMENTISINHNWLNACNIVYIWHCLHKSALEVEKEMSDCKSADNWEDLCQVVLKELQGLNYDEFLKFLAYIFEVRSKCLNYFSKENYSWAVLYDIKSIQSTCSKIINCKPSENVLCAVNSLQDNITDFLLKIE